MSWLTGLADKAESLLNNIDQSAASALQSDHPEGHNSPQQGQTPSIGQQYDTSVYLSQKSSDHSSKSASSIPAKINSSSSVPTNLNQLNSKGTQQSSKTARNPKKKDADAELFEFLNSSNPSSARGSASSVGSLGRHSRQSSTSSTTSGTGSRHVLNGSKTPDSRSKASTSCKDIQDNLDDLSPTSSSDSPDDLVILDGSYPSTADVSQHQRANSSLQLENELLKNEVTSLSQEMNSVIQRVKSAQQENHNLQVELDALNNKYVASDQILREMRSRESDYTETLRAKDSQLGVLRVRWEEADAMLKAANDKVNQLQSENNRILEDHTSVSGVQNQAMDNIREKLNEAENNLRLEKENVQSIQKEFMNRHQQLESEKNTLAENFTSLQKKYNDEKAKLNDFQNHLKMSKTQADNAKQELADYKEKAMRTLQSKDRLIASLKSSNAGSGVESSLLLTADNQSVASAELESVRQERDLLREELARSRVSVEGLRGEIQELEMQVQSDGESFNDQIQSLEDQLSSEKQQRVDAETEFTRQKKELEYMREELVRQKSTLQSQMASRDADIDRLRTQLTSRSAASTGERELEARLHTLTESLIQKQTTLEALSTEKNSLHLQLERLQKEHTELESVSLRSTAIAVRVNEDDELRQRVPSFMRESALDSGVARNMKKAANNIDRFSIKLGIFLRRYPIARVLVICYMILLHFWVMIVLLTYQPEIHGTSSKPLPQKRVDLQPN